MTEPLRRMELADVVTTSAQLFRRRFGMLLKIAVIPALAAAATLTLAVVTVVLQKTLPFPAQFAAQGQSLVGFAGFLITASAMSTVYFVMYLKATTAGIRFVIDDRAGIATSFRDAWRGSRGVLRKSALAFLIAWGAYVVLSTVIGGVFFLIVVLMGVPRSDASMPVSVFVAAAFFVIAFWGMTALIYYFWARLAYLPALLADQPTLGFFSSAKRAWQLTKRQFWRTLGFLLVLQLMCTVPTLLMQLIPSLMIPVSSYSAADLSGPAPDFTGLFADSLGSSALLLICSCFVTGYQIAFLGDMYLGRRAEEAPGETPEDPSAALPA